MSWNQETATFRTIQFRVGFINKQGQKVVHKNKS